MSLTTGRLDGAMMAAAAIRGRNAAQGVALSETGSDIAGWARAHGASFEVGPLVEMVKGQRAQVGFTITLHARLPLERGPGADRRAAAAKVWEGLREIAQSLAPKEGSRARAEIDTPRTAAYFAPDSRMEPEVALNARVFHAADYFTEVTAGEETRLHQVTRRLTELGLTERRPPTR